MFSIISHPYFHLDIVKNNCTSSEIGCFIFFSYENELTITHTLVLHSLLNKYHGMYYDNHYNNFGYTILCNRPCKRIYIHQSILPHN